MLILFSGGISILSSTNCSDLGQAPYLAAFDLGQYCLPVTILCEFIVKWETINR